MPNRASSARLGVSAGSGRSRRQLDQRWSARRLPRTASGGERAPAQAGGRGRCRRAAGHQRAAGAARAACRARGRWPSAARADGAIRTGPAPAAAGVEPEGSRGAIRPRPRVQPHDTWRGANTGGEREARQAPAVAPADARAATATARAFLGGYLPYSYGRAEARSVRAAARRLLREMGAAPPRVPGPVAVA